MDSIRLSTPLKEDGTVVKGHEGCWERIAEYFEVLYNVPPPAERLTGGVRRAVVAPVQSIREDPSSCQQVKRVDFDLNGGQATGECRVPAEPQKVGRESMPRWLRTVIVQVWSTGVVPIDWRRGLVTPIYRGEESEWTAKTT